MSTYRTYARCFLHGESQTDSLVRIVGDERADRTARLAAMARLLLNDQVEHVINLESSTEMKDVLHGLGRILTGTYIYVVRRKTRRGTVTKDDIVKIAILYNCMSKYMIDDEAAK